MRKISLIDIKYALKDQRFRDSLPETFKEDIQKYLQNPGCACNSPIYKRIMTDAQEQIKKYYPNREISNLTEEAQKIAENNWTVINCHKDELEQELKKLPIGRKQLAVTRFEDQITVIVNSLEQIF